MACERWHFWNIKPFKEERIRDILLIPDGPLARLMPCSAAETAANGAVFEILQIPGHLS